jgi:hypothetical protein
MTYHMKTGADAALMEYARGLGRRSHEFHMARQRAFIARDPLQTETQRDHDDAVDAREWWT